MLEYIIDSTQKSALLAFLGMAPNRSFTSKELSTRLGINEPTIVGLLQAFAKLKIVNIFSKKSKKYYVANPGNKFFSSVRASVLKQQPKYEDELFAAIRKLGDVHAAFLSGLFSGQPHLPVDVLIIGKVSESKLAQFLGAAQKMMGQEINYSVMSVEEFDIRRHTFDRFIKDIFDHPYVVVLDKTVNPKTAKK